MENLNSIIAKNICEYRKQAGLTQSELANLLNFSDKSISKWERGESIPDINVLVQMCEIFDININELIYEHKKRKLKSKMRTKTRVLISLLSSGMVWLVATMAFVFISMFAPSVSKAWLSFIYAIPVNSIVLLVFACIWSPKWLKFVFMSVLIWTSIVSICLTFNINLWMLIYIGIPLQVLVLLWFTLERILKR